MNPNADEWLKGICSCFKGNEPIASEQVVNQSFVLIDCPSYMYAPKLLTCVFLKTISGIRKYSDRKVPFQTKFVVSF